MLPGDRDHRVLPCILGIQPQTSHREHAQSVKLSRCTACYRDIEWLTRYVLAPSLTQHPRPHAKPPVAIQSITDQSHPARGQFGLFAAKKIPPRTFILDYIGEVHCDDRPDSDYDLALYRSPDYPGVGVDARSAGNEARFINDYRGVKPKPNALFQERRTEAGELRMSIWSGSEVIKKGDELLVSYGKSWWKERFKEQDTAAIELEGGLQDAGHSLQEPR